MKNQLTVSEHLIQSQILQYLPYYGIYAWRSNAGRYPVGEGANRRMVIGAPNGTPDLIGICGRKFCKGKYFGRFIGIEVKREKGKTTDIQNRVIEELHNYGALVFVIHSLDELKTTFDHLSVSEG